MRPTDPARWCKEISQMSGYFALAVERRKIGTAELRDYATRCERLAREMKAAAEELKRG